MSCHRPEGRHLEHDHLDGLDTSLRVFGTQLAGLLGEIDQDRAGLGDDQAVVDDHRDLVVGIHLREFGSQLVAAEEDAVNVVLEAHLLDTDGNLQSVGGRVGIQIDHVCFPVLGSLGSRRAAGAPPVAIDSRLRQGRWRKAGGDVAAIGRTVD
jgi:hypothetical protein